MRPLAQCAPSRWVDFLCIPNDAMPTRLGEDTDLFVGRNTRVTITLNNGTETRFRDVVVLGELALKSSDPENTAVKPTLIARDVFCAAKMSANNVSIECRNCFVAKNIEAFHSELLELFLERIEIQSESVARIALKFIFVPTCATFYFFNKI